MTSINIRHVAKGMPFLFLILVFLRLPLRRLFLAFGLRLELRFVHGHHLIGNAVRLLLEAVVRFPNGELGLDAPFGPGFAACALALQSRYRSRKERRSCSVRSSPEKAAGGLALASRSGCLDWCFAHDCSITPTNGSSIFCSLLYRFKTPFKRVDSSIMAVLTLG